MVTGARCGVTPSSLPTPAREKLHEQQTRRQIASDPDRESLTGRSAQRTGFLPIQKLLACNGTGFLLAG